MKNESKHTIVSPNTTLCFLKVYKILKIYCGVEQLVARWAHNPKVIGSSPVPATKESRYRNVSAFLLNARIKG